MFFLFQPAFGILPMLSQTHDNGSAVAVPADEFAHMAEVARAPSSASRAKRNAVANWNYLWDYGVVYFEIDGRTAGKLLLNP